MFDPAETARVRRALRRSWVPFFTRFGRLTPVQIAAIPRVLAGVNTVIVSPTASGKTEAVVAPVVERVPPGEKITVVCVVPTRALANDALARLQSPLLEVGWRTSLKHGDRPELPKEVPQFLITTPESLDSLICRKPTTFEGLRVVILDEIHLVDTTYRGDQLRVLLRRLARISKDSFRIHLLSATLADPDGMGRRYCGEFETIVLPGQREIEYDIVESYEEVRRRARERRWRKILCFCNFRESVEGVASTLAAIWKPYPVVAHHGSLDRRLREEAESVMRESDVAVCVATSTLEVGIDIGDIDVIVLGEVPWSVVSLLQRIGRGNRRERVTRVLALASSEDERALLTAMFETAKSGTLPSNPYEPDLSVVIQQVFSCLFERPSGISSVELSAVVSPLCSRSEFDDILAHLRDSGWVEYHARKWVASMRLMDQGEKGRIHSNIPDSRPYRVVDVSSGREIGRIAGLFDDVFALGRQTWKVVSVGDGLVRVRRFKGTASPPRFARHRGVGAFYRLLPPSLRKPGMPQLAD